MCAHACARAHTHIHTHCTLPQMMKESLVMSLSLKIWDVCWLGSDHSGVDNTPPRSNYVLAWGAESFTSGQYYWEVNVTGCCKWAMGFCNGSWSWENDTVLNSEGIFLFLWIKQNTQCRLLPPLHKHLNLSEGLWARWGCSWLMMVVLWVCLCVQELPHLQFPLLLLLFSSQPFSFLWAPLMRERSKFWPQWSGIQIMEIVNLVLTWISVTSPSFMKFIFNVIQVYKFVCFLEINVISLEIFCNCYSVLSVHLIPKIAGGQTISLMFPQLNGLK